MAVDLTMYSSLLPGFYPQLLHPNVDLCMCILLLAVSAVHVCVDEHPPLLHLQCVAYSILTRPSVQLPRCLNFSLGITPASSSLPTHLNLQRTQVVVSNKIQPGRACGSSSFLLDPSAIGLVPPSFCPSLQLAQVGHTKHSPPQPAHQISDIYLTLAQPSLSCSIDATANALFNIPSMVHATDHYHHSSLQLQIS